MINLFNVSSLLTALMPNCPSFNERFYIAIPDDDLTIERHQSPTAFIYENDDEGGLDTLQRVTRQAIDTVISIDIVIRRTASADDLYGETDVNTLNTAREEVMTALLGYQADGLDKCLTYIGGKLHSKNKTEIKWRLQFKGRYFLTQEH